MWEAQFATSLTAPSPVIDEYVTRRPEVGAAPAWSCCSPPHGQEVGRDPTTGPHERYLQMCAQDNMLVAQPPRPPAISTAASTRTPARAARSSSSPPTAAASEGRLLPVEAFTGTFQPVIGRPTTPSWPRRRNRAWTAPLCSGRAPLRLRWPTGPRHRGTRHYYRPSSSSSTCWRARPSPRRWPSQRSRAQVGPGRAANQGMRPYSALNLPTDSTGAATRPRWSPGPKPPPCGGHRRSPLRPAGGDPPPGLRPPLRRAWST